MKDSPPPLSLVCSLAQALISVHRELPPSSLLARKRGRRWRYAPTRTVFAATIDRTHPRLGRYTVEYDSLLSSNVASSAKKKLSLRETVKCRNVHPHPPPLSSTFPFAIDRAVDAYYNDAWWTGVVEKIGGGEAGKRKYTVCFRMFEEVIEFGEGDVRPHREWVDGKWIDPPQGIKDPGRS